MRKTRHSSVIFRVALVLFCLVLFSAHLSSGMLAKYRTTGEGSISADIAQPEFTVTSTQSAPSIAADGTATYAFTATNSGEVAASYSLVVALAPGAVAADDADRVFGNVRIDGNLGTYDSASHGYVFADLGSFEPGDSASHTLTFDTADSAVVSDSVTSLTSSYQNITVLISAKAVQID